MLRELKEVLMKSGGEKFAGPTRLDHQNKHGHASR